MPEAIAFAKSASADVEVSSENPLPTTSGFSIPVYDYFECGYDGSGNNTTVVYKHNSVVVATVTMTYDAVTNKLLTATRT